MSEITAKLKFTQDTLIRLTGKKVSHKEIKDNYLKLLSNLKRKTVFSVLSFFKTTFFSKICFL